MEEWIEDQLLGTSVTVVLLGSETSTRPWVLHEIKRSYKRGNGMLGIYLHNIKDFAGHTCTAGSNTFGEIGKDSNGQTAYFSVNYTSYDWVLQNGYANLGDWVEEAAKKAGR